MAWNLTKIALVAAGTVGGGALCFLTAGAAAPLVGGMIGSSFMGLSGAAATSAGLAALGGGALAAGGGGMAAGAALIATCMATAGGLLGALGMGTVANFFRDTDKQFEEALFQQRDIAKAQEVIRKQEAKIRELKQELANERSKATTNSSKIDLLEQAIMNLEKSTQEKSRLVRGS